MCVEKGLEFYDRIVETYLKVKTCTENKKESIVAERFIRVFKNLFYKYNSPFSKSLCFYKLGDIISDYSNTKTSPKEW